MSQPTTPEAAPTAPVPANGVAAALEKVITTDNSAPPSPVTPISPTIPGSPTTASSISPTPFRRGHGRQASLGTTMTSPSTRRRSIESTMSLIKEVYDGKSQTQDTELDKLAEQVADKTADKNGTTPDSDQSSSAPAS